MFIDTHAHLLDERFNNDRAIAIERAKFAGVTSIIEIACEPQDWQPALDLCKQNNNIRCALGIHPNSANKVTDEIWQSLENAATNPSVIAIGETGLDYHYDQSFKDVQKDVFLRHLELAAKLSKPVVMHCREAYGDFIEIISSVAKPVCGVVHCFSGSVEQAELLVAKSLYLGIDGPLTYPKSDTLRGVVQAIPLDRMLLETDCPYLPPQQFRGKRNEPAYIPHIAQMVAQIKGLSLDEVARITTNNAITLFNLEG